MAGQYTERPHGWQTRHDARRSGRALVAGYLGPLHPELHSGIGDAYGDAVFDAWPAYEQDLQTFVEERLP